MEYTNDLRDHHDEHKKDEHTKYDYEKMGSFMNPQMSMGYNQMQGCPMYGNPMYCPMFQNPQYGQYGPTTPYNMPYSMPNMPNMPYKVREDEDDFDTRPYYSPSHFTSRPHYTTRPHYYSRPHYSPYPNYPNPYFYPRPYQMPYFFPFF